MSIRTVKTKFSGHNTFPLRYGWIYKGIEFYEAATRLTLSEEDRHAQAMIEMGVGRNMVDAINYWLQILKIKQGNELTPIAKELFILTKKHSTAFDEHLEKIGTLWLLHWLGQSDLTELTAARWFFNYQHSVQFSRESLTSDLKLYLKDHSKQPSDNTLKKDVDCVIHSYAMTSINPTKCNEDSFTCPFTELKLILPLDNKTYFAPLAARPSLPVEIFIYALLDYCGKLPENTQTVSFQQLLTSSGSPARVFRLNADALADLLDQVQQLTHNDIGWTDTQGLRQVQINKNYSSIDLREFEQNKILEKYYKS
ncbi:MAG: DUF4007 family protein [Aeromonas sp.]